jgi:polynucleotide 5'-hydroxyl-kinase GRC3/NOL9
MQSVGDSSDVSMEVDGEGTNISSFFNNRAHEEDLDENRLLSTFQPSPDQNMFFLTAEEQSILNLSDRATLIALNAQDSLCLLGTCNLTILHGSVTLCGTTLLASSTKHPFYAPRSSPLPIIRASFKSAPVLSENPRLFHHVFSKSLNLKPSLFCRSSEQM